MNEIHTQDYIKIAYGIFDGENMVSLDEVVYPVPPNYISKSRLIQGDHLKLMVTAAGKFLFKQIKMADRKEVVGTYIGRGYVEYEGEKYRVIDASIRFFQPSFGDSMAITIPANGGNYAAVRNMIGRVVDGEAENLENLRG